ncbi:MAG TPA: hypothetical protein VGD67_00690 [Pseudonocardiaceae bacterium]
MTLLRPELDHLDDAGYQLFRRAQRREPWSATEIIGRDRTALDDSVAETAWHLASTGYYAEQAGLVAAAELAAETEDFALRMGLATAVADEARHADAFLTYALARGDGALAEVHASGYLDDLHGRLNEAAYLEKCLLHTLLEGLAADEFVVLQQVFTDDPLGTIYRHVRSDEVRHVAIGLDYLRRSYADPATREEWDAHGAEWERRCLELANLRGVSEGLGALLGRPAEQLERWFVGRHRARLRGAGMRVAATPEEPEQPPTDHERR